MSVLHCCGPEGVWFSKRHANAAGLVWRESFLTLSSSCGWKVSKRSRDGMRPGSLPFRVVLCLSDTDHNQKQLFQ